VGERGVRGREVQGGEECRGEIGVQGLRLTGVTCCYTLATAAIGCAERYCHPVTTAVPALLSRLVETSVREYSSRLASVHSSRTVECD
jgi:hypothetical protein